MDEIQTGNFIAELRKQNGMTQRQLAEKIGVSDKTISKWETGKSIPDLLYIADLCEILNISVNELLAGERISENNFSKRADETIISLMVANEINSKSNAISVTAGLILIFISSVFFLILSQKNYSGIRMLSDMFFDVLSLLFLIVPISGIILITKKRTFIDILNLINKIVVPTGAILSISSLIFVLNKMEDWSLFGTNFSVAVLALLYSLIIKLIVVVILSVKGDKA